jgi:hypothetical protein
VAEVYPSTITQQLYNVDLKNWGGSGLNFLQIIDPKGFLMETKKIILH